MASKPRKEAGENQSDQSQLQYYLEREFFGGLDNLKRLTQKYRATIARTFNTFEDILINDNPDELRSSYFGSATVWVPPGNPLEEYLPGYQDGDRDRFTIDQQHHLDLLSEALGTAVDRIYFEGSSQGIPTIKVITSFRWEPSRHRDEHNVINISEKFTYPTNSKNCQREVSVWANNWKGRDFETVWTTRRGTYLADPEEPSTRSYLTTAFLELIKYPEKAEIQRFEKDLERANSQLSSYHQEDRRRGKDSPIVVGLAYSRLSLIVEKYGEEALNKWKELVESEGTYVRATLALMKYYPDAGVTDVYYPMPAIKDPITQTLEDIRETQRMNTLRDDIERMTGQRLPGRWDY